MRRKSTLTLVTQPQEFFRELLREALGQQRLKAQPETEVYLVNLLNYFMKTDCLYARSPEGIAKGEALALLLKEALEEPQPKAQSLLFRRIGDVSLYISGFFQDSLSRKLVDVDYYIEMGGAAYGQVANRSQDALRAVYRELANKFGGFVEVLAEVSDKTKPKTEKDLLRLYEVWIKTRSERAARSLQQAGIFPNKTLKKDLQ